MVPAWYPHRGDPNSGIFNQNLSRALAGRYDVSVIYIHFHEEHERGDEIEIERAPNWFSLRYYVHRRSRSAALFPFLYAFYFLRAYRRVCREFRKPELIYSRNIFPCGFGALAARILHGARYITRESFSGFSEHMKNPAKRFFARRILKGALHNSAVSEAQRAMLKSYFPDLSIDVVGNVIDAPGPAGPPPTRIEAGAKLIFVGSIVPIKGWDVLLKAFRLYLDRGDRSASLTIVGVGDDAGLNREIDALKLRETVHYLGSQPNEKVRRMIAEHHFLILTSHRDTCPNVLLEAFAAGRPVFATRCGGAEDLVRPENGLMAEAGNPEAVCEAIREMVANYSRYDPETIRKGVLASNGVTKLVEYLDRYLPSDHA